ncbi:phosphotransferase hpr-related protein : Phosphocarrier protein HPr OS=Neisseria weaveri LMG 5135 GN=l11_01330 PE=4 SV=1: PTS-HPr [Gemmata massiliana]|uniref:HPr domain-containing protein n=2 Tax=Gemmata massiliana TaxID=1210884 RepID=A0A6P2D7A3_9BACT|nr:phosphotransferase hpr-related protein : Phosphocarrier protein HPr OS=Neisseria weaveri LMG 5135 GN=l11_01330 PE=4 SV=1: PTS-HPr [Gemmata massiliana]
MTGRSGGNGPGPLEALPQGACAPAPLDTDPPTGSETTMPESGPLRRVVRIVNPLGLHQRVADRFSRTARQYACTVTVWNGDARADGKSLWDLILLVAMQDTELVLEVDGPDALKAVDPLVDVLASPGGEDYTI